MEARRDRMRPCAASGRVRIRRRHPVCKHALRRALVVHAVPAAPATSPPNSVLCADAAALRASLGKLTHVKVGAGTVSEITADLNDVKANLTAFANQARGQWQAQTSALTSALATLKTAVSNLAAHPSTSAVSGCGDRARRCQYGGAEPLGRGEHALSLRIPLTQQVAFNPGAACPLSSRSPPSACHRVGSRLVAAVAVPAWKAAGRRSSASGRPGRAAGRH